MHNTRFVLFLSLLLGVTAVVACDETDSTPTVPPAPPVTAVSATTTPLPASSETAVAALPTTPAPTPLPSPLPPDPNLPAWTILVYLNVDHPLAPPPPDDLVPLQTLQTTLSTFTPTTEIPPLQVIAQVDRRGGVWNETRRYALTTGAAPSALEGEPVESLGELDMTDGAVLADFLAWGRENYPANRYALILLGPGNGWRSLGFDDDGGTRPGTTLTLDELETAVTAHPPLDLIALHAAYAAQLDVLDALTGGARYAIAPPQFPPAPGPTYSTLLSLLRETPQLEGGALARQVAAAAPTPLLAADLSALPPLTHATAQLAATLNTNPSFTAGAVADAAGAAALGFAAPGTVPTVDLAPFAATLAQRSPDPLVSGTAVSLTTVMEPVRLTPTSLALAFPSPEDLSPYQNIGSLSDWSQFLVAHANSGRTDRLRAKAHLPYLLRETVGAHNPAYYNFEVAGADLDRIIRLGGSRREEERRLLWFGPLTPQRPLTGLPDTAIPLFVQDDGVTRGYTIWDGWGHYLAAGENGGFVVAWPPARLGSRLPLLVSGRLEREGVSYPARAIFEANGAWVGMWAELPDGSLTAVMPVSGDAFRATEYYLPLEGDLDQREGGALPLDGNAIAPLSLERRPVPDGPYFLGVATTNTANEASSALAQVMVEENGIETDTAAYLDPLYGFQFRYPAAWPTPRYEETRLVTGNVSGTIRLQLTVYPNLNSPFAADDLADETLAQFGGVDTLFTEAITLGEAPGRRLAYGYEDIDGNPRTGLFATVVREETGFVIDVDGPAAQEGKSIAIMDMVLSDWQFTEAGADQGESHWQTADLSSFTVPQPITFTYGQHNTWHRFNNGQSTFIAFRLQPSARPAAQALSEELAAAGVGVSDFRPGEGERIALNGRGWRRASFSYQSSGNSIRGMIIVHKAGEQEIVVWAEAPDDQYATLAESIFLVMVAGMRLP